MHGYQTYTYSQIYIKLSGRPLLENRVLFCIHFCNLFGLIWAIRVHLCDHWDQTRHIFGLSGPLWDTGDVYWFHLGQPLRGWVVLGSSFWTTFRQLLITCARYCVFRKWCSCRGESSIVEVWGAPDRLFLVTCHWLRNWIDSKWKLLGEGQFWDGWSGREMFHQIAFKLLCKLGQSTQQETLLTKA